MSLRTLVALAVLVVTPLALPAAEPENPYKKAQKGDWAEYKMSMKFGGQNIDTSVKQTVIEKTDKELTIEAVTNVFGMEQKQKHKIDLTKPYDPLSTAQLPPGTEAKIEKKDSGKEKVKVSGKDYETEWTKYKMTMSAMGQNIEADMKVWLSKDVPLGGLAKMNMKMSVMGNDVEMDMTFEKSGK